MDKKVVVIPTLKEQESIEKAIDFMLAKNKGGRITVHTIFQGQHGRKYYSRKCAAILEKEPDRQFQRIEFVLVPADEQKITPVGAITRCR